MFKEEKEKIVADLTKIFAEAKGVYLTDFSGINVDTINDLRRQFRQENIDYRVVKNTLTRLSIKDLPLEDLRPFLDGPTGIAFSYEDPLLPGKLIEKFHKETNLMPIKAALIEGSVYDKDMAEKIVNLPSRDTLIAQLLGTLQSPISGLAMVLSGLLRNLVGVLDAIKQKQEEGEGQDAESKNGDEARDTAGEPQAENKDSTATEQQESAVTEGGAVPEAKAEGKADESEDEVAEQDKTSDEGSDKGA